jgi:hypothetical protein
MLLRTLVLSATVFAASAAPACELTIPAPVAAFDDSLHVLTGTVRAIVGPIASDDVRADAYALRVAVTENLHTPEPVTQIVDILEYDLGAGCDPIGKSRADLERRFPPGVRVRVVAKVATKVPAAPAGTPTRLEVGPLHAHVLLGPIYAEEPLSASLAGVYDFATPIDIARLERIDAERFIWSWYDGVVGFEAIKELLRLARASADHERVTILRRLRRLPSARAMDFEGLVQTYVRDPAVAATLRGDATRAAPR